MIEKQRAGKPWLASYPPGIPAEIDIDGLGTLVEMFEASTARFADRKAVICFGASMSYAQLGALARAFAVWLQGQGIAKGDRVAVMMPNVPAYPVALFGTLLAGATVVNVNPLYTPRELAAQLNDSGARTLVVLETFAHTVAQALPTLTLDRVVIASPGDGLGAKGALVNLVARHVRKAVPAYSLPKGLATRFTDALKAGRGGRPRTVPVAQGDLAFLQYTGGTTGVAKAAMLTHRNVIANVVQSQTWFRATDPDGPERVMVTALPLYHIFALTCCLEAILEARNQNLIHAMKDLGGGQEKDV